MTPLLVVTGLSILGVYAIVVAAINKDFLYLQAGGKYLSPLYSPDLSALFGWHNGKFPYAFLVLWAPLGLRSTCYYYRKSYYRSYFLMPPACAVSGLARRKPSGESDYKGETKFPWVLNNVHRVFFYFALIVVGFLWYDAIRAFIWKTPSGTYFGIGLGSMIMLVDVILLSGFTLGCNSFRHLIGGGMPCLSCSATARVRQKGWRGVSFLNARHSTWAWFSLFSV
ncbi:MAG: succinate dehydrogenase, partial [Solirubrobacteraceae bacterium]